MAIVANPMPVDTLTAGKKVVWFDPDATAASAKYGIVQSVTYAQSGSGAPVVAVVRPVGGNANGSDDVTGSAALFRVVDDFPAGLSPHV